MSTTVPVTPPPARRSRARDLPRRPANLEPWSVHNPNGLAGTAIASGAGSAIADFILADAELRGDGMSSDTVPSRILAMHDAENIRAHVARHGLIGHYAPPMVGA